MKVIYEGRKINIKELDVATYEALKKKMAISRNLGLTTSTTIPSCTMHSTRRSALPEKVHQIWDCIEHGHGASGALVDMERLVSVAHAVHKIKKEDFEEELEKAVSDGLVVSEVIDNKGNEVEVFSLPDARVIERGDHDWYCFACHKGGNVLLCEDCTRVFHLNCLPELRKPEKDLFVCPSCHMMSSKPSTIKMNLKPKVLNTLLTYICERLKSWEIPFLNTADPKIWAVETKRAAKEAWRFNMLVYSPMDLKTISEKASAEKYASIEEFQVDCETLVHAIGSFFGADVLKGNTTGASFMREALHDIQEVKLCHDCFRRSNEKNHAWWFCLPCATPHKVVWAKQTGYPFWPAKVMKQEGNKYDVRYFGGGYERAVIDAKNIQPIETSLATLKVRRTANWNEAYDELQKFMEIAKNPELVNSLPSRGKASSAKAVLKPTKRTAKSEGGPVAKKSKGLDGAAKGRVSTPGGYKKSSASTTPNNSLSTNGVPAQRKKGLLSPRIGATSRDSSGKTSSNSTSSMSTLGKESIIPPTSFPEDVSIESFFETVPSVDLIGESSYSDDEEKASNVKVSEDAVSSSCGNVALTSRSVYVQVTTKEADLIETAKKKLEAYHVQLKEHYNQEITANKKKQWCFNCEKEAIYHCCWNTAYCSTECQQFHWTKEHKRLCRRKKPVEN